MNSYYLGCFNGGLLSLNLQTGNFQASNDFTPSLVAVIYQQGKLYIELDNQLLLLNIQGKMLTTQNNGISIQIKLDGKRLVNATNHEIGVFDSDKITYKAEFKLVFRDPEKVQKERIFFEIEKYEKIPNPQQKHVIPRHIWLYWEQTERPRVIEQCYQRLMQLNPNTPIHFLDKTNLVEFLSPDFIALLFNADITPTLRSDLIRLQLLYQYGGIWVDASIIFNQNLEQILRITENNPFELVSFYSLYNYVEIYPDVKYPIFESWLLASPAKSRLIKKWLDYLLPVVHIGIEATLDKLRLHPEYEQFKRKHNEHYFIVYVAQQAALHEIGENLNLLSYCAEQSAFYFQAYECYSTNNFIFSHSLAYFLQYDIRYLPPLIKLTGLDRKCLAEIKADEKYNKNSYLAPFL